MNNRELDTEKYKQELMKLYSRIAPQPRETEDEKENAPDDTVYAEHIDEDSNGSPEDYNSRYPEPDLSELDTDFGTASTEDNAPPEYDQAELLGAEKGYIPLEVYIISQKGLKIVRSGVGSK